jgi:hypothetical protein
MIAAFLLRKKIVTDEQMNKEQMKCRNQGTENIELRT